MVDFVHQLHSRESILNGRALVDEILAKGGIQALLIIVLLNFLCVTGCDEF